MTQLHILPGQFAHITAAHKTNTHIATVVEKYRQHIHARNDALFLRFLPVGYRLVALDSVAADLAEDLIVTKTKVGMLITLYDDLADNPELRRPALLQELYKLPFDKNCVCLDNLDKKEREIAAFVEELWDSVLSSLQTLPHYEQFKDLVEFDIRQFYNANRYGELLSKHPQMANQIENRTYQPHNMGMMIVFMIDLMASSSANISELGMLRDVFYKAQVLGRLSNVLNTLGREIAEKDVTGEIIATAIQRRIISKEDLAGDADELKQKLSPLVSELQRDYEQLYCEIQQNHFETCDAHKFAQGIRALHQLHENMQREI